jgi:hypothetical protein
MEKTLPLHDIILPEPIGWWPPAIGWWALLVLIPLLIFLLWRGIKWLRRKTAVKTALKLLKHIRQNDDLTPRQKLAELSMLLRRVAISTHPEDEVAGLTGKSWLQFLDQSMPDHPFSQGAGQCLATAQYQPAMPDNIDLDAVFSLCEQWIKKQR